MRWIVQELVEEQSSKLPGSNIASSQLAQLFFVKILRAHLGAPGAVPPGWLRAVGDERILQALRLMHADPSRDFTLGRTGEGGGDVPHSLRRAFKSVAGRSPLAYLTEWRMLLAKRSLREENAPLLSLAQSLGYASESAFSNAFKRVTGAAPRDYRTSARASSER